MKKLVIILFLLIFIFVCACREKEEFIAFSGTSILKNKDRPLNGSLDIKLGKIWEAKKAGDHLFASVQNIALTKNGSLAVLDKKNFLVHFFEKNGDHSVSFGKKGEGPGEIKHLGHGKQLFIVDDRVWIADMGKIHVFSRKGEFIKDISYPAHLIPRGFPDGKTFVSGPLIADSRDQRLILYSIENGEKRTVLRYDEYEEADNKRQLIRTIIADGITPMMIVSARNDKVYYGLNSHYTVNMIDLSTKMRRSFSIEGRDKTPVRQSFIDYLMGLWKDYPSEKIKRYLDALPDHECYFQRIFVNVRGYVFVCLVNLDEDNKREIDIFSPEGKYIYRAALTVEAGFQIKEMSVEGNRIALAMLDQEHEYVIAVYTIDHTFIDPGN